MTTYKLGLAAAALVTAFAANAQTDPQSADCNPQPTAKTAKQKPGIIEGTAGAIAGGVTKDAGKAASQEISAATKGMFGDFGKHLGGLTKEINNATKGITNAATQAATGAAQSAAGTVTGATTKCPNPTPAGTNYEDITRGLDRTFGF